MIQHRSPTPPVPFAGFTSGVLQLQNKLRHFIRRRVRDHALAEDLTQETLLRIFRSRSRLRDDTRLEAWVFQIARNTIAGHFRRNRPAEELSSDLQAEVTSTNPHLRALASSIQRMIEELPPLYRAPLLLSEIQGLPHASVARRLGISLTATKSRVRRGRQLLLNRIRECCRLEFNRARQLTACEPHTAGNCDC